MFSCVGRPSRCSHKCVPVTVLITSLPLIDEGPHNTVNLNTSLTTLRHMSLCAINLSASLRHVPQCVTDDIKSTQ